MKNYNYSEHLPEKYGMKPGAERFPLMVLPQVSNICNSSCVHCWFDANPHLRERDGVKYMSCDLLKKIVDEVAMHTDPKPLLRITGTGEPFVMPGLVDVLEHAGCEKGVRIGVISNGSLITPDRSMRLIDANIEALEISVDAADKYTYERVRRGLEFGKIIANIEHMVSYRDKTGAATKILVSVVENPKEIDCATVEAFWRKRVDNVIMRKYLTYGQISEEGYSEEAYLPPEQRVPCPYPFERMVILASGDVTFCNFDVEDCYFMGNLNEQSIEEIWRGPKYEEWRSIVLDGRFEEVPLCAKCNDWKYKSWQHNYFKVLGNAEDVESKTLSGNHDS
jgi:radical SAM protein with 4Fe4S-binding SPASM domain